MLVTIDHNTKLRSLAMEVSDIDPADFKRVTELVMGCGATIVDLALTDNEPKCKIESEE